MAIQENDLEIYKKRVESDPFTYAALPQDAKKDLPLAIEAIRGLEANYRHVDHTIKPQALVGVLEIDRVPGAEWSQGIERDFKVLNNLSPMHSSDMVKFFDGLEEKFGAFKDIKSYEQKATMSRMVNDLCGKHTSLGRDADVVFRATQYLGGPPTPEMGGELMNRFGATHKVGFMERAFQAQFHDDLRKDPVFVERILKEFPNSVGAMRREASEFAEDWTSEAKNARLNTFDALVEKVAAESSRYTYGKAIAELHDKGLPEGYENWSLADKQTGRTVAHEAARLNALPPEFPYWWLADKNGRTVAHDAAEAGFAPNDERLLRLMDHNETTVAHLAAASGNIPASFEDWGMKDFYGKTVAEVAAVHGSLPENFQDWSMECSGGQTVLHVAAAAGHLPESIFDSGMADLAEIRNSNGETVFHTLASHGRLPEGFQDFDLATPYGNTVAHCAAASGCLPETFGDWGMANKAGVTVAHTAAQHGHLPESARELDFKDNQGNTVAHYLAKSTRLPEDLDLTGHPNNAGVTVAHVAAAHGNLPESFQGWSTADNSGNTVAHEAAISGSLPETFQDWGLKNGIGNTVAHEAAHARTLPEGFSGWDSKNDNGVTVAHIAAKHGDLPQRFDGWGWKDNEGNTVAQEALKAGTLPKQFGDWMIRDGQGNTLAHLCAQKGFVPEGFDQWDARNKRGETVAHAYVRAAGTMPENFKEWGLEDSFGISMKDLALRSGNPKLVERCIDFMDDEMRQNKDVLQASYGKQRDTLIKAVTENPSIYKDVIFGCQAAKDDVQLAGKAVLADWRNMAHMSRSTADKFKASSQAGTQVFLKAAREVDIKKPEEVEAVTRMVQCGANPEMLSAEVRKAIRPVNQDQVMADLFGIEVAEEKPREATRETGRFSSERPVVRATEPEKQVERGRGRSM